jgi:hypothetical protein
MIKALKDLYEKVCSTSNNVSDEEMERKIKSRVYKGTECGAWVNFVKGYNNEKADGVTVGSIVEGVDDVTNTYFLSYPFEVKDFWDRLGDVEREAEEIWNETHGCEECFPEYTENIQVNPDCTGCKGNGVAI